MKTFENGVLSESDGPPLEHEEWAEETRKAHEREEKARTARARPRGRATPPDDEEDEELFAGKPLGAYDGVPDEELTDQDGVGDATAEKIIAARKRRK